MAKQGPRGCKFLGTRGSYPFTVDGYARAVDDMLRWTRSGDTKGETHEGLLHVACDGGAIDLLHCWFDKVEGEVRCHPTPASTFECGWKSSRHPIAGLRRRGA